MAVGGRNLIRNENENEKVNETSYFYILHIFFLIWFCVEIGTMGLSVYDL